MVVNVLFKAFHDARSAAPCIAVADVISLRVVAGVTESSRSGLVFVQLSKISFAALADSEDSFLILSEDYCAATNSVVMSSHDFFVRPR